jgi:hypothetical protein
MGRKGLLGGEGGRKYTQSCNRGRWGVRDDLPPVDASSHKTQSHRGVKGQGSPYSTICGEIRRRGVLNCGIDWGPPHLARP